MLVARESLYEEVFAEELEVLVSVDDVSMASIADDHTAADVGSWGRFDTVMPMHGRSWPRPRARIVDATDEERRRVVRDRHDGAQQRLVHSNAAGCVSRSAGPGPDGARMGPPRVRARGVAGLADHVEVGVRQNPRDSLPKENIILTDDDLNPVRHLATVLQHS